MKRRIGHLSPVLLRRCLLVATGVFTVLMGLTILLWRSSVRLTDYRMIEVSRQNSQQAIIQLGSYLEQRILMLRTVAQFCAHSEDLQEREFQGFASARMADTPGVMAIVLTDRNGAPIWIAPPRSLDTSDLYMLTAAPSLSDAMDRSLRTFRPVLTDPIDLPQHGKGCMATCPILGGSRQMGFIVGLISYQELLNETLLPDVMQNNRVAIWHERTGLRIFPRQGNMNAHAPLVPLTVEMQLGVGDQNWRVSVTPTENDKQASINFTSLTILVMGLCLSFILGFLVWRWQWRAAMLQTQASDNAARLERTGVSLVEIKSELDLILNSVDEGIILYDEQLEPVQSNVAFLTLFNMIESSKVMHSGHAHHEHMVQFMGSESRYWSLFDTLHRNPEQIYTDQIELPATKEAKEGRRSKRVFLRRATTVCGADGQRRGMLVIYKDVTSTEAVERVKDDFLSSVTHELRSPLASIKGFAEMMRREPTMAEENRKEFINIICEESTRLQQLIEELLDLRRMEARNEPMRPAPFDFRAMVEDVARGGRTVLLAKNITTRIEWDGSDDGRVLGEVAQITRALRNLLVNAVKYSPEGSEIVLHGHCGPTRVWLEVTDQGIGIDEKDLPHIFDKFYRGTRHGRQKGTGLGLAIVKHIVERHGGHLGVRSEVGAGTTFRVELPRQPPTIMPVVMDPRDAEPAAATSESA